MRDLPGYVTNYDVNCPDTDTSILTPITRLNVVFQICVNSLSTENIPHVALIDYYNI